MSVAVFTTAPSAPVWMPPVAFVFAWAGVAFAGLNVAIGFVLSLLITGSDIPMGFTASVSPFIFAVTTGVPLLKFLHSGNKTWFILAVAGIGMWLALYSLGVTVEAAVAAATSVQPVTAQIVR